MTRHTTIRAAILLLLVSVAASPWAANKTVNLKLIIAINAPPPCTVTAPTVEFGTIMTTNVDGSSNAKQVPYNLICSGGAGDYLKMQIQGTAMTVNGEQVLKTDVNGLGIRLQTRADKTLLPVGTSSWWNFQPGRTDPVLEAVLVKSAGTTLTAGEFNAAATLVVEYQ